MYATKMRRMLASLLAVVALFSMSAATASADGGELYEVSVYVPVGTDVSFYPTTGLDAGGVDQFSPGDEITADITPEADYNVHKMQLRGGTYSFRGTDADDGYDVGGSVFDVPAKLYGGGVSPVDNCEIYLRRAKIGIYNAGATAGDFTVSLRSEVGVSTLGGAGVHTGGEPVYHALLYVNGNANLYSYAITPTGEYAQSTGVAEYSDSNQAYTAGTTARIILATLPAAKYVTLNAPKGAKAALYEQINNYNTQELAPDSIDGSKSDGTTDYVYRLGSGNYTYRVSAAGYVTQAGYLSSPKSGQVITVEFDPALNPKAQLQSQTHDGEASALLNINERNKLSLQVGGKFKVRAYRAAWQIVNSVSSNIMIEPDFTYSVISGADVIKIEQEDGGNAGGNWAWITALKAGVAIVEVTYDAIVIDGSKLYGANDALRTGVFVVHVGSGGADIGGIDWDAEYDTHYFLGETGGLTINPDGSEVSVRVAPVAGGGMSGWAAVNQTDNGFEVPIECGNNIIEITANGSVDYRVIRGSRLAAAVTSPNANGSCYPGDTVTLSFSGLYQPMPKFGGIYNPGFGNTMRLAYNLGGTEISSAGTQYELIDPAKHKITFTIPAEAKGELVLAGGLIKGSGFGSAFGTHRTLTDAGIGANFSAPEFPLESIPLPDISITITRPATDDAKAEAIATVNGRFTSYSQNSYSTGNWAILVKARDDGIAAINGAASLSEVAAAKNAALTAMASVEKLNAGGGSAGNSGIGKTHTGSWYKTSGLTFELPPSQIAGYVSISFSDNAVRLSDAGDFKVPLGVLIRPTEVPFKQGDSMADVTLRLLDALGIGCDCDYKGGFYLRSIKGFKLSDDYTVNAFGEFDSGPASGWMVTLNSRFINEGAGNFLAEDGDVLKWQYTCQLGADIGCDWNKKSAEILGISFLKNYGSLSPAFSKSATAYIYTVPKTVKSVALEAVLENYWSIVTYTSSGVSYKPMREIPVGNGTVIQIDSSYAEYAGDKPSHSDSLTITIQVEGEEKVTAAEPAFLSEKAADITIAAVSGKDGVARASVDTGAVKGAVDSIRQTGSCEVKIEVELNETATGLEVSLQSEALKAVANEDGASLTIECALGAITLDNSALKGLIDGVADDVEIVFSIAEADADTLPDEIAGVIGGNPVFSLTAAVDGNPVSAFGGIVTVFLPFEQSFGGNTVYHVGDSGELARVESASYDLVRRGFTFTTTHFSLFIIAPITGAMPFEDVSENDWFYGAVKYAYENGLMSGIAENIFAPDTKLSRAMLVTVLYRFSEADKTSPAGGFGDVQPGEWYYDAVLWAEKSGIVLGYGDGRFGPDDAITREQAAVIFMRYAKYAQADTSKSGDLNAFFDASEVSDWASEAMNWASATGLIKGTDAARLSPQGTATRAQIAEILMRFCEQM